RCATPSSARPGSSCVANATTSYESLPAGPGPTNSSTPSHAHAPSRRPELASPPRNRHLSTRRGRKRPPKPTPRQQPPTNDTHPPSARRHDPDLTQRSQLSGLPKDQG